MINLVNSLLSLFDTTENEDGTIGLEVVIFNNDEWKSKINGFIGGYLQNIPEANAITAFFRKHDNDAPFIFLPHVEIEQKEFMKLYYFLKVGEYNDELNEMNNDIDANFGDLLANYEMKVFGNVRVSIGEK